MKKYKNLIILTVTGLVFSNSLQSQSQTNNVVARNLANYLGSYLNMDLKEKEFIISVLNNKNYDYNQKIYMLQTDSLFSNHFFALERFRQILINTGQLLDIQESDLDFISIIATDTIIGTIPNINPCDAYRREVNACTRKMLDDWTSNFLNPLKMLLIAWEYNDCLKTADEKYPKCIVRHTIHKDLTQSKNKLEIGLSDPSIQN